MESYIKNDSGLQSKFMSRLDELSAGNINLKKDSIVIKGFDTRVKSSLHMHSNKYNNSEGV